MKKSNYTPRPRKHDYMAEANHIVDGDAPALCTADAAAIVLAVTGKHVRSLFRSGKLGGVRLGRAIRIRTADVRRLAGLEG